MERWLRTDNANELVSALREVARALSTVEEDVFGWKWALLALHNAVYGFMVAALHSLDTYPSEDVERWLDAHEFGGPYPADMKIDRYLDLYAKVKSDRMNRYTHSRKFEPSGTQGGSIKALNRHRNRFLHFPQGGWSLQVSGLPRIILDCLDFAEFLGWESGNVTWTDDVLRDEASQALQSAREVATFLESECARDAG